MTLEIMGLVWEGWEREAITKILFGKLKRGYFWRIRRKTCKFFWIFSLSFWLLQSGLLIIWKQYERRKFWLILELNIDMSSFCNKKPCLLLSLTPSLSSPSLPPPRVLIIPQFLQLCKFLSSHSFKLDQTRQWHSNVKTTTFEFCLSWLKENSLKSTLKALVNSA